MQLSKPEQEIAGGLRRLFKSRFIVRSRNEKWFQVIVDRRKDIQKILDAFCVRLEINETLGVAHLEPLSDEFEEVLGFQLGKRKSLSPLASVLMFYLRQQRLQFFLSPTEDAVPMATRGEMRDFLQNFNRTRIDSQFERAFQKSLDELLELQALFETRQDSGIYEISGLCEILLPLDRIQEWKIKIDEYCAPTSQPDSLAESGEEN